MSTGEELLMKGTLHGSIAGITRKDVSCPVLLYDYIAVCEDLYN